MSDKHVQSVVDKHQRRAEKGLSKYGVTLERTDLSELQWLQHLQEELMDAAVYIERRMDDLQKLRDGCRTCQQREYQTAQLINRRVEIESELLSMAEGNETASPEQLRDIALRLGASAEATNGR